MNAAKDAEHGLSGRSLAPILDDLKKEAAKVGYRPQKHKMARSIFRDLESYLPKKAEIAELPKQFIPTGVTPAIRQQILERYGKSTTTPGLLAEPELPPPAPDDPVITLRDIHNIRSQDVPDLFRSKRGVERKVGALVRDALDKFRNGLTEADVVEPGTMPFQEAKDKFNAGLTTYSPAAKVLELENLVRKAQNDRSLLSQGGIDAAISKQFRQLSKNEKKMKLWSPEEQSDIENMAQGGDQVQRLLRIAGKAAPRGVVSGGFDVYLGSLLHHFIPGGPIGMAAAGEAAHRLTAARTLASVKGIQEKILPPPARKAALRVKVSPKVYDKLLSNPTTNQAVQNWAKATGPRKAMATAALARAIARAVNVPKLVPRIEQEINDLDNQDATPVKD